jgi:DNA-binding transcriptional regulator YiaG
MRLGDGRTLFVEVPARMAVTDRGGGVAFSPEGVRFLDRVRALASRIPSVPSPAFLATLREALGLTQEELGKEIGRDKLTISRWERGTLRPSPEALARLDALARKRKRAGILLPG